MSTKRLFFAAWPGDSERRDIERATRDHVENSRGKPTRTSNLHATLAFLGSVAVDRIADVEAAAERVRTGPFELCLDSIEHWKKPGILALCAKRTPRELAALVDGLWHALEPLGFIADTRPFKAHVTLVRRAGRRPPLDDRPGVTWNVDEFVLAESVTDPEGAFYKVLRRYSLVGAT